ncbi:preprotein translocase subunit SecE [Candidatus Campbellbacteria bacterium]|nr:MAG: preprotein translocase subunit SecE [Candidatus Campbellbacteria bacterium]
MSRFIQYLKDTQTELKHVSWPTRAQAIAFTIVVVAISVFTAAYLGAFDALFTFLVQKFLI